MPAADASACCVRTWGCLAKASAISGGRAPWWGKAWPHAWGIKPSNTAKAITKKTLEVFDFMEFII
jgi:hypothetical protein